MNASQVFWEYTSISGAWPVGIRPAKGQQLHTTASPPREGRWDLRELGGVPHKP